VHGSTLDLDGRSRRRGCGFNEFSPPASGSPCRPIDATSGCPGTPSPMIVPGRSALSEAQRQRPVRRVFRWRSRPTREERLATPLPTQRHATRTRHRLERRRVNRAPQRHTFRLRQDRPTTNNPPPQPTSGLALRVVRLEQDQLQRVREPTWWRRLDSLRTVARNVDAAVLISSSVFIEQTCTNDARRRRARLT